MHKGIVRTVKATFPRYKHVVFTGEAPLRQQAALFHRAALVLGPHGGAFSNLIFCQLGVSVIEYIAAARQNSPLYMRLANWLGLHYWPLLSTSPDGSFSSITPHVVVSVATAALKSHRVVNAVDLDKASKNIGDVWYHDARSR